MPKTAALNQRAVRKEVVVDAPGLLMDPEDEEELLSDLGEG